MSRKASGKIVVLADLGQSAIAIIGLWEMGITNSSRIAYLLGRNKSVVLPLIEQLKFTKNAIVCRCVKEGLPPQCGANLYPDRTVRCKTCFQRMVRIPCLACKLGKDVVSKTPAGSGKELQPARSTIAVPGTMQKIRVFQARILRGEPLFHRDDKRL
jgi:hypothetical protein